MVTVTRLIRLNHYNLFKLNNLIRNKSLHLTLAPIPMPYPIAASVNKNNKFAMIKLRRGFSVKYLVNFFLMLVFDFTTSYFFN